MGINSEANGLLDSVGLGNITLWGGQQGHSGFMIVLVVIILAVILTGLVTYFIIDKKRNKFNIEAYSEVNGVTSRVGIDKARIYVVPKTSIKVLLLKKNKVIVPFPTIQIAQNTYAFFIRDDYEWVNIGIENINKTLKELGIKYNHVDMRYANEELKELISQNYGKSDFLQKWGGLIALVVLVILIGVAFYFIADKIADASSTLSSAMSQNAEMQAKTLQLMERSGLITIDSGVKVV